MQIHEYFTVARSTAIYPDGAKFYYPTFGLIGECAELNRTFNYNDSLKEAGDCFWYIVNCVLDAGFNYGDWVDRLTRGQRADNFTELTSLALQNHRLTRIVCLQSLGVLAGIAKKALRDNYGQIQDHKRDIYLDGVVEITLKVMEHCHIYGINIDDVVKANKDKLASRKERGVLQGDGDNR